MRLSGTLGRVEGTWEGCTLSRPSDGAVVPVSFSYVLEFVTCLIYILRGCSPWPNICGIGGFKWYLGMCWRYLGRLYPVPTLPRCCGSCPDFLCARICHVFDIYLMWVVPLTQYVPLTCWRYLRRLYPVPTLPRWYLKQCIWLFLE